MKKEIRESAEALDVVAAEGGNATQTEAELFERMRVAYAKFKAAMEDYDAFLEERTTFGFSTPDGATGARRLHAAEHDAHKQYHEALRELRKFVLPE